VIEHVGECALSLDLEPLGNREGFAEACGKVEESGTLYRADLRIAEAANWVRHLVDDAVDLLAAVANNIALGITYRGTGIACGAGITGLPV